MENLPVIIAEVSVAPSGELFRNTFFFLRMFQTFYRRFYQNTTNHVMGSRADHAKSRYEAYSGLRALCWCRKGTKIIANFLVNNSGFLPAGGCSSVVERSLCM